MRKRHSWPEQLIEFGQLARSADLGDYYWLTQRATVCSVCGRSRRQAKGVPCA